MKRTIFIFILIPMILSFGCSSITPPTISQETEETSELQSAETTVYLTESSKETKNSVAVVFDEVEIRSDQEKNYLEKEVASWLKEMTDEDFSLVLSESTEKPNLDQYEKYYVDLTGKTTYRSETMTSVIFQGLIHLKSAAHPMHVFFSLNYHPDSLEPIHFSEIHSATEELYIAFASEGEKTIKKENGDIWPQTLGTFSEVFCSKEDFFNGLKMGCPIDQRVYFYYTEENIGFSFSVPYVLGGHKEIELSRSFLISP